MMWPRRTIAPSSMARRCSTRSGPMACWTTLSLRCHASFATRPFRPGERHPGSAARAAGIRMAQRRAHAGDRPGAMRRPFRDGPDDWKPVCEWGALFYSAAAKLRFEPSQCLAKQGAYEEAGRRIAAGEPAEAVGLPNVGIPAALPAPPPVAAPDLDRNAAPDPLAQSNGPNSLVSARPTRRS